MSTTTNNLGLVKPELSDNIYKTIENLSSNFQKLDDASEIFMDSPPISGYHPYNTKRWNSNSDIGEYIGWVNVRQGGGTAAPLWQGLVYYNVGDTVVDADDNTHYYTCTVAGTSGVNEPTFPVTTNATIKDIKGAGTWSKGTYYEANDMVLPSVDNGFWYLCVEEGNADNTLEPTWRTIEGETFVDGDVTWKAHKIITWQESGISARFRPFGKIE